MMRNVQRTRVMFVRVGVCVCAWLQWNVYGGIDGGRRCQRVRSVVSVGRLIRWCYVVVEFSDGNGFDG